MRAPPDNPLLAEVGLRVREARTKAGLSQEELGHKAGLDRTYISGIERGRRNVAVNNLIRIAAALGVDAGALVAGLQPHDERE